MNKIKELISNYWLDTDSSSLVHDLYVSDIEELMIEYAEWYAKQCLEIAAEKAETEWGSGCDYDVKIVNKSTILNIELPNHE